MRSTSDSAAAWSVTEGGKGEEEIFSLADVVYAAVLHAAQGVGDGLALRVEHGALEGDVDMGFHWR